MYIYMCICLLFCFVVACFLVAMLCRHVMLCCAVPCYAVRVILCDPILFHPVSLSHLLHASMQAGQGAHDYMDI